MSPTIAYDWLQMARTIEKAEDRNLNKMFKRHIKNNLDNDNEYNEVYKAFTYGLQLNRGGDRKSWYEKMKEKLERRDLRRRIKVLNYKKAYSICGDRDPLMFTKYADKKLQSLGSPMHSPTSPTFLSSRKERYASYHMAPNTAPYNAKTHQHLRFN